MGVSRDAGSERSGLVLITMLLAGLCAPPLAAAPTTLPTTTVELGGTAFVVEIASNDAQRMRGLMYRESMPADHGMLFVFDRELPLSFWMKNTRIALDMLYFDRSASLVSIQKDVPPCVTAYCPSYPSDGPAQYVLELNGGRSASLQLPPAATLCERSDAPLTPLPRCR